MIIIIMMPAVQIIIIIILNIKSELGCATIVAVAVAYELARSFHPASSRGAGFKQQIELVEATMSKVKRRVEKDQPDDVDLR